MKIPKCKILKNIGNHFLNSIYLDYILFGFYMCNFLVKSIPQFMQIEYVFLIKKINIII